MKSPLFLLAAALIVPGAALATEGEAVSAPAPAEHRLSDLEIEAILDEAAAKREAAEEELPPPRRRVHGEAGVAIGTGGFRSIYGTSVVPLGEDGTAVISFESTDFGKTRLHRRRHR